MNLSSHLCVSLQTTELVQYFVPLKNEAAGTETFYWHQTILSLRQLHFVLKFTIMTAFLNPLPHSHNIHSPALTKMYRDMQKPWTLKTSYFFAFKIWEIRKGYKAEPFMNSCASVWNIIYISLY